MERTEWLTQVGHTGADSAVWVVTPQDIRLPHRERNAHKGDFGRVCILGGCVGYSGAPVLAAKAAVHTGSGLVTVLVPRSIWQVAAGKLDSAMPWPLTEDMNSGTLGVGAYPQAREKMQNADAVLIGPGLSRVKGAAWLARKLSKTLTCPLVLDADGINAWEGHIDELDEREGLTVLTPHDGEFARVGGDLSRGDRVEAARRFAQTHRCILVLKGHRTVTAFPDGDAFVNTTGNPGMAKGGSGDVLAGMVLSLLGQGIPAKQAVPWGVCLHGQAGDLAAGTRGEYSMTPLDIIVHISAVLKTF